MSEFDCEEFAADFRRMHFDRNGRPMALLEWAAKLEDPDYKRVAEDTVDGVRISTVWLGLNHAHSPGECLIFETMIFGGEHDEYQRWYPNAGEAIRGHNSILDRLKRGLPPEEPGA